MKLHYHSTTTLLPLHHDRFMVRSRVKSDTLTRYFPSTTTNTITVFRRSSEGPVQYHSGYGFLDETESELYSGQKSTLHPFVNNLLYDLNFELFWNINQRSNYAIVDLLVMLSGLITRSYHWSIVQLNQLHVGKRNNPQLIISGTLSEKRPKDVCTLRYDVKWNKNHSNNKWNKNHSNNKWNKNHSNNKKTIKSVIFIIDYMNDQILKLNIRNFKKKKEKNDDFNLNSKVNETMSEFAMIEYEYNFVLIPSKYLSLINKTKQKINTCNNINSHNNNQKKSKQCSYPIQTTLKIKQYSYPKQTTQKQNSFHKTT